MDFIYNKTNSFSSINALPLMHPQVGILTLRATRDVHTEPDGSSPRFPHLREVQQQCPHRTIFSQILYASQREFSDNITHELLIYLLRYILRIFAC